MAAVTNCVCVNVCVRTQAFTDRQTAVGVGVTWETERKTARKNGERGSRDGDNKGIQTDRQTEKQEVRAEKNKC